MILSTDKEMDVPPLLSAEDFINPACDELSMMTYLSGHRSYYDKHEDEIVERVRLDTPEGRAEAETKRKALEEEVSLSID